MSLGCPSSASSFIFHCYLSFMLYLRIKSQILCWKMPQLNFFSQSVLCFHKTENAKDEDCNKQFIYLKVLYRLISMLPFWLLFCCR